MLKEKLEKQLDETKSLVESLPWENKEFYANFVAQTYYFVCHSTRLLGRSISYFGVDRDPLYRRFVAHLKEEDYHERIAKSDLMNMGIDIKSIGELSITKAFWQTQFYRADESKGISLLGYILYLEAIAVSCFEGALPKIQESYGKKSMKFMQVHSDEDPDHLDHAIEMISKLEGQDLDIVLKSFNDSAKLYHLMLEDIKNETLATIGFKQSA